jgi:hypothetical protein
VAAPTVRGVGAVSASTGAATPGLPSGTVAGDLLFMLCESEAAQAVTASGWTEVLTANEGTTRLTLLARVATGSDSTTTNDAGDHVIARILGITAGTYDPAQFGAWVATSGQEATADTSAAITGPTIPVAECLALFGGTAGVDPGGVNTATVGDFANAGLSGIVERMDNGDTPGTGGAIGMATGLCPAPPASLGTLSWTWIAGTGKTMFVVLVKPLAASAFVPQVVLY